MATILYNDCILSYKKLKQLDEQLDTAPTARSVMEMAETRIQNLQAFAELQSYNADGIFLYLHPLIAHRSEHAQLEKIFKEDLSEFLRLHKCCLDNIRRYESYLKRDDRKHLRNKDKTSLHRHRTRAELFKTIITK
ncbi:MAG: hypothetical protein LBL07_03895 [Tannerella sp.]|jgi:hypothetical protein|nr:hypothetical protein [Tannerella sp.]